ncbi:MAG: fumarylacetoacetate hydrolase family protein [Candidatus Bathyarchaeia archaeon]
MKIVRFWSRKRLHLGILEEDYVVDLTSLDERVFRSFRSLALYAESNGKAIHEVIEKALMTCNSRLIRLRVGQNTPIKLAIPVSPPEVWCCGVTYKRSQEAREAETLIKGIYDIVYNAARPEIFFKGTRRHCVGPEDAIGIRGDSSWSVPEPELAFVLGHRGKIIGFTGGNDVSSRDIEGENPLYLTQAKTYKGSCAIGPAIVTVDQIGLEPRLQIECEVFRNGKSLFKGSTNTAMMKRRIDELRSYLLRFNPVPFSSVCLTGTGIVPPDDFSLEDKDIVEVRVEQIGVLRNRVRRLVI